MSSASAEAILVLGNHRPTVSIVRSLGRAGWRVVVGRGGESGCAERSRAAAEAWDHPALLHASDAFADALSHLLASRPEIRCVFPASGPALTCLCKFYRQLPPGVILVMPDPAVVTLSDDKPSMLEVAARLDLPCPHSLLVTDWSELGQAAATIGYPCVVKPTVAELLLDGEKALICATEAQLSRLLPGWPDGHTALLVQSYVRGLRHNLHFAARHGVLLACLDAVSLRTLRPNGTGLTVEGMSVPLPESLRNYCRRLVAHLSYTGVGCLQFIMGGKEQEVAFLELNPRLAAGYAIAQLCGLDLPVLAVKLACGSQVAEQKSTYPTGRRFVWTYGDLNGVRLALTKREIGLGEAAVWLATALRSGIRADMHLTWRLDDPGPTLGLYARALGLYARALGAGRGRR